MRIRVISKEVVAMVATVGIGVVSAAEAPGLLTAVTERAELDRRVGQPVDIAPWAYEWRADRAVQRGFSRAPNLPNSPSFFCREPAVFLGFYGL